MIPILHELCLSRSNYRSNRYWDVSQSKAFEIYH
ncbi:hypothetical protein MANES_15G180148v8 [Manihot esculenta]|uniref:Uncharacterized protein n=1 Tax=Manihot esculenta TaxID=3983 RepID=A0ACB7GD86_MANES|nr:hypothetical protein MANES_15G180148v8 [Manihot esculenta]